MRRAAAALLVAAGALSASALPASAGAATDCGTTRHAAVLIAKGVDCAAALKVARGWNAAQRERPREVVFVRGFRCGEVDDARAGEMARVVCRRIALRVSWYPVG